MVPGGLSSHNPESRLVITPVPGLMLPYLLTLDPKIHWRFHVTHSTLGRVVPSQVLWTQGIWLKAFCWALIPLLPTEAP